MAIKTFSTGEVLTASDTNTYLANAGLVYITTADFTGVTTVSVNNCFSSTFRNYFLQVDYTASSAGVTQLQCRFRASGTDAITNYYTGVNFVTWAGVGGAFGQNPGTYWYVANKGSAVTLAASAEIHNVNVAVATSFFWNSTAQDNAGWNGRGVHTTASAYDGFTLLSDSGTITGTVRVYGYRQV